MLRPIETLVSSSSSPPRLPVDSSPSGRAETLARALATEPVRSPAPDGTKRERWLATGDPQASLRRFLSVLDHAGILGDDGRIRSDTGLLSIGDHFDYGTNAAEASADGLAILHWLASHPPDQVVLLIGNHDIARVTELAYETDESFRAARAFAGNDSEFFASFPHIPTRGLATRDYSGFSELQRTSVQKLLMTRRFALAAVAMVEGHEALFVHAGFTDRELAVLHVSIDPHSIARALNRLVDERVARVSGAWQRGEIAELDLRPLHVCGDHGIEGGGFLYHRPANLQRESMVDPAWERDVVHPRRYDPRTLPRGLVQVVGHTSHKKLLKELTPWCTPRAQKIANGGLRTLRVGSEIVYDVGIQPPHEGEAVVYLIDSSMSDESVTEIPLLPIGAPEITRD